jgi:hypothetical protein
MPVTAFVPARSCALIDDLNREWSRLRVSEQADAAVTRWRAQEPAVFGCACTLDDVMTAAGRHDANDPPIAALLRLAQAGDAFARRTVLQLMLGAMVRMALRTRHMADQDLEEAVARAISALWTVILSYPVARRTRHVNNISLDVLNVLTPRRGAAHREQQQTDSWERLLDHGEAMADIYWQAWDAYKARLPWTDLHPDLDQPATHPPLLDEPGARRPDEQRIEFWQAAGIDAYQRADDEQLLLLLAWAVRTHVIARRDAQVLLALHSSAGTGRPASGVDLAADLGLTPAALRQRAHRATVQLQAAVQAYAASPITELSPGRPSARRDPLEAHPVAA